MKSKTIYLIGFLVLILLCLKAGYAKKEDNDENKKKTNKKGVTYDGTSLIINGKRELLYSGSVHYPRSTPDVSRELIICMPIARQHTLYIMDLNLFLFQMWPSIIEKARVGRLNTIQTYVFWNVHEPEQGKVIIELLGFFDG